MKRRAALTLILAGAGVTTLTVHHHKPPAPTVSDQQASVYPLRADRTQVREPLPVKRPVRRQGPRQARPSLRLAVPAGSGYADVTMYCATGNRNAAGRWPVVGDVAVMDRSIPFGTHVLIDGNVYTVRDWIGSGSDYDIYGGSDAGCEQRALNFGRRHLRVVVER